MIHGGAAVHRDLKLLGKKIVLVSSTFTHSDAPASVSQHSQSRCFVVCFLLCLYLQTLSHVEKCVRHLEQTKLKCRMNKHGYVFYKVLKYAKYWREKMAKMCVDSVSTGGLL